ncbi:hypothetical protein [Geoalkalibacter subterraneus]|uniref:hypothetical protein n=1 Tax=Geoalkalibacter subterraneus TaxID=483547 RepID=UPI00118674C6|nr:hypothetical protein [Geoalkalibacter subterraneus]
MNADKGGFTQMKTFKPNLRITPQNPETLAGYTLRIYRFYAFDLICVHPLLSAFKKMTLKVFKILVNADKGGFTQMRTFQA